MVPIGLATRALTFRAEGNWVAARAESDRGIALAPQSWDQLLIRVLLEFESGNFSEGRAYLEQMTENMLVDSSGHMHGRIFAALAIALVAHITGIPDRLDAAQTVARNVVASPSMIPLQFVVVAQIILALSAVQEKNNTMVAHQYDVLQTIKSQYVYISGDRLLGLLAHTLGKVDEAKSHFEAAVTFCRTGGYRPELAWSCCEYAEVLLQSNYPEDHIKAISLLEESLGLSRDLGMSPLIERVLSLQGKVESPLSSASAYPDGLSKREVEVLRLMALGKSNRDISEELVISLRTVAHHVTSILNKTGAANRTEAAAYAARHGLVPW